METIIEIGSQIIISLVVYSLIIKKIDKKFERLNQRLTRGKTRDIKMKQAIDKMGKSQTIFL